jgi:hypothetical protein
VRVGWQAFGAEAPGTASVVDRAPDAEPTAPGAERGVFCISVDGRTHRTISSSDGEGARDGPTLPRLVTETTPAAALVLGAAAGGGATTVIVAIMPHSRALDIRNAVASLKSLPLNVNQVVRGRLHAARLMPRSADFTDDGAGDP